MPLRFPKPHPDQERYNNILREGFKNYPERLHNFKKCQSAKKQEVLDYLPVKMDVENVSRCNLKCDMCQVNDFPKNRRAEDMLLEEFERLIDEQYGLTEVKIQGMGEPFLGKTFIDMIAYASSKDIWVRTSTNATILDKNENYKRVIDAGIGEVQISVDGTSKETYEKIRINASFDRMVENCKLINGYCEKRGFDGTRMWVLLQKTNLHELHHFPAFAEKLGFKRIAIIMDVSGWGNHRWTEKNNEKTVSGLITQNDIDMMLEEADHLGVELGFWDIAGKYTKENLCPWPFERAYISSEGKVVPCCMIANPDRYHFDVLGEFTQIWKSDSYRLFRRAHLTGRIPEACRNCYQ